MVNCFAEANAVPKKLVYKLIWQIRTLGSCDVIVHHSYRKCTDGKRTRTLAQDAQLCPVFANCACQFTLCTDTCWRIRLEKLTGRTILKQTKGIFWTGRACPFEKDFHTLTVIRKQANYVQGPCTEVSPTGRVSTHQVMVQAHTQQWISVLSLYCEI